jgi:hypothetical protein
MFISLLPYYKTDVTNCTQASQNLRHIPSSQPLPDSAFIISNLPLARYTPLTTTTKAVRTSMAKKVKNNTAALNRKAVKGNRDQSGQ